VADGIRQGRCNITHLILDKIHSSSSEAAEAVRAIASAIRLDRSLEHLTLKMRNGFTDEAGLALAEALTVNTTLRKINLNYFYGDDPPVQNRATLGAQASAAFGAMLLINTSLVLELPAFLETDVVDERLCESRDQMRIEQLLNEAGRGRLLASTQTPKEEWVDALNELNSYVDESPAFQDSCLFSLLRLSPSVVSLS
jgi:hypothetical protein